jgi:hypothetical protein
LDITTIAATMGQRVLPIAEDVAAAVKALTAAIPDATLAAAFLAAVERSRTFEAHPQGLSLEVCQQLERLLTDVVGPIAATLCLRSLPSAHDVPSVITALAPATPDPARATAFLTAAWRHFS